MKTLHFVRQFLRQPSQTGALNPSSPQLAREMVAWARLTAESTILEFGPGTGVFTEVIAEAVTPTNTFLAIEINPNFAEATRRRCPDVTVIQGSAADSGRYLAEAGQTHCDRIISGLPWAVFAPDLQDCLLDTIQQVLRPGGGRFVTFAYVQGLLLPAGQAFKRKLHARFARVGRSPVVWQNVPPAFVYWAEN